MVEWTRLTNMMEAHIITDGISNIRTDCSMYKLALFDHVKSEGNVPDDKHTAVYVAALKNNVSAGVGRNECKAQMRWVASRWMIADGLTKRGLSDQTRAFMRNAVTRIHEESAQALLRVKKKGKKKKRKKTRRDAIVPQRCREAPSRLEASQRDGIVMASS